MAAEGCEEGKKRRGGSERQRAGVEAELEGGQQLDGSLTAA